MTSPSHHRDLSGTERQRVQELLSGIETSLNGNTNPSVVPLHLHQLLEIIEGDETLCGGLVKTTKVVVITRRVLELYRYYREELSTSNIIDANEAEMQRTMLESPAVQISTRILRVLVENAHSRRSFSAILPQSCRGFLYLLRCIATSSDITRVLCHVLLHTQEGKEVLDELVSQHNFTGILTQLCLDCVERSQQQTVPHDDEICLLLDVLRLLSASVSVTPRPDSATILADVCGLVVTILSPLISARAELWHATMNEGTQRLLSTLLSEALLLCSVLVYESMDAKYVNEVEAVAEGLIQRWRTPTNAQGNTSTDCHHLEVALPEHLVMFWRGCKALPREEELSYQREHSEEEATALQMSTDVAALLPLIIRRMKRELCTIRKYNLDSSTVQKCLFTIHGDLAGGGGGGLQSSQVGPAVDGSTLATRKRTRSNIAELSSYVIARVPGGVKTLCGTLSTVDEEISSVSCAVLTSLFNACNASISSSRQPSTTLAGLSLVLAGGSQLVGTASTSSTSSHPTLPSLPQSKFVAEDFMMHNAMDQFVSLDGVLLLADMLDDYSEDVLTGAFSVLASLLPYHKAVKDVLSNGVLEKVRNTFEGVTLRLKESIVNHPLQQRQMAITVTVMCFEFVARVPQFALAPLVNMGPTIRDVSNLIEGRLWDPADTQSQPDGGPSRECSVALIIAPFLRAVANLLSIDPANVLDGLGMFETQWCERWLSAASAGGLDTFTASLYSIQALLTCIVSTRGELLAAEEPQRLSRLVEIVHSLAMALFSTTLEASRQMSLQTQFWTLVDTIVSNQLCYGVEVSERLKEMLVDALIGALQVLAAAGHEHPTFVSATLPPVTNLLLQWNVLRRNENVLNLIGSVAVSEWAAISDRSRCISLLQSLCSVPPESLASDEERTVAASFSSHYPLLLTRVIMLCEEYCGTLSVEDEGELSCLANLCFSSLLDLPRLSVPALVGVGATALHYLVNPEGVGFAALGWLGFMEDADDAHDTLVAVVPLINGILNQSTASRTSLSSNDNFVVFFAQLIACEALEVPLKVLGLYSLWHLLTSEGDGRGGQSPAVNVAAMLIKWNIISLLERLLAAAKAEGQSAEATAEIKHACYLLAERVTILSRSCASLSAAAAGESFHEQTIQFLVSNAFEDSTMEGQACSYLLCLLQDDALRSSLHHHYDVKIAVAYRESLNKLYQSVSAEMQGAEPQHYYVIIQLNKYISECEA